MDIELSLAVKNLSTFVWLWKDLIRYLHVRKYWRNTLNAVRLSLAPRQITLQRAYITGIILLYFFTYYTYVIFLYILYSHKY